MYRLVSEDGGIIADRTVRASGSLIVALSLFVSTVLNASQPRPQLSMSRQQEAERMFAASPQRELKREWDSCVNTVAELIIAQGGTLEQVRQLAFGGCADKESRLTGAMVREFGYDRGNRSVQGIRDLKLRAFESRISAGNAPRTDRNVTTTPEGWKVRRDSSQNCTATHWVAGIFGTTFTYMAKSPKEDTLGFGELGGDARSTARFLHTGETITASAIAIKPPVNGRNTNVSLGRITFTVLVHPEGFAFIQSVLPEVLQSLEGAEAVQLVTDIGYEASRPRIYHVEGMASARQMLLQCAQR